MDTKCINCAEFKRCKDSYTSWLIFIIGLVATIAMRIVTVLMHVNPVYGKISWYAGVGGFFVFFIYKFKITQARSRLVEEHNILEKINQQRQLSAGDYKLISGIICSLTTKKERINYFFIFGLSAVALILAIYIDFFRWYP